MFSPAFLIVRVIQESHLCQQMSPSIRKNEAVPHAPSHETVSIVKNISFIKYSAFLIQVYLSMHYFLHGRLFHHKLLQHVCHHVLK